MEACRNLYTCPPCLAPPERYGGLTACSSQAHGIIERDAEKVEGLTKRHTVTGGGAMQVYEFFLTVIIVFLGGVYTGAALMYLLRERRGR
jgi:hypothetical protein